MSQISLQADHPTDALPEFVRGAASNGEEIERHLATCEACRVEVEILRALADATGERMSDAERARVYRGFLERRVESGPAGRDTGGWLSVAWKLAAAIALLLTSVGVWQVVKAGGSGDGWDPQLAIEAWAEDLADLNPGPGEVRIALGFGAGALEDPLGVPWDELEDVDPIELAAPWEDDR